LSKCLANVLPFIILLPNDLRALDFTFMVKLMLRCFGKPLLVRRGFFDDNLLAKANVYWGWGHYGMAFRVPATNKWIASLE
jgi:hypothetical protein